jgi:hypothetical protein
MSDFIESGRNFASDVSVDGDHDAQQYVIGFEDSDGSFVEVGRLENVADNVSQPLEIKHQNSGERITLDSSGLKTQKIDDDRLYAGVFSGADADARLSNCLSEAKLADTIYLENATYTDSLTVNKPVSLIGSNRATSGTVFNNSGNGGTLELTERSTYLSNIRLENSYSIKVSSVRCVLSNIADIGGGIQVTGNRNTLSMIAFGSVTFSSSSSSNIIDTSTQITVTDNGSNTVGDIS